MAKEFLDLWIHLDNIVCHDEGDGWGSAEPYLWPIFFKVDGQTIQVEGLSLSGAPVVVATDGSHGNLGNTDVDGGDVVPIPSNVGSWNTVMYPIRLPDWMEELNGGPVGGVAGVVVVLMEEDNVSDAGAIAGYAALVNAVRNGLTRLVSTLGWDKQTISDAEIDALKEDAVAAVADAIKDSQSAFQNLWSWFNPDDQIGASVFQFTHDELATGAILPIHAVWNNHGRWELNGHAHATTVCTIDAAKAAGQALGVALQNMFSDEDMAQMRSFRDEKMPGRRGLHQWRALAERHSARVSWLIRTNPAAAKAMATLAPGIGRLLRKPEQRIPTRTIRGLERFLDIARKSGHRGLRIDAGRARSMVGLLDGLTVQEALEVMDLLPPTRRPEPKLLARVKKKFGIEG